MQYNEKPCMTQITVVNTPEYIIAECPDCFQDVKIPYQEFRKMMGDKRILCSEDYADWVGNKFLCPKCGKLIEIEGVKEE